jgi:hypothetical protein
MLSFLAWDIAGLTTFVIIKENIGGFMNRPERRVRNVRFTPADSTDRRNTF